MQDSAQNGYLVVADITGYSAYLSHSELEHAANVVKLAKCAVSDRDADHHQALSELMPWIQSMKALGASEEPS